MTFPVLVAIGLFFVILLFAIDFYLEILWIYPVVPCPKCGSVKIKQEDIPGNDWERYGIHSRLWAIMNCKKCGHKWEDWQIRRWQSKY